MNIYEVKKLLLYKPKIEINKIITLFIIKRKSFSKSLKIFITELS